jgi:hypothetical protein
MALSPCPLSVLLLYFLSQVATKGFEQGYEADELTHVGRGQLVSYVRCDRMVK